MFNAPTRRMESSTTGNELIACCCMRWTACAASISGATVTQFRVMTSSIRVRFMSTSLSMARRRSPSVKTPRTRSEASTTAVIPSRDLVISTRALETVSPALTRGTSAPVCITSPI